MSMSNRAWCGGLPVLIVGFWIGAAGAQEVPERARPTREPEGHPLAGQWQASGENGAVVAGGAEAVAAGLEILKGGGNAADAAAATLLALAVTDANQFCLGGEVPILVYNVERDVYEVLAGQGAAPRLATIEHFVAKEGGIPGSGIESATVPAALDAIVTLLDRHGTRRFEEIAAPTLRILDRGEHAWHADLAKTLRHLIRFERGGFERGRGLRLVADEFYRGSIARRIDAWSRASGGLIRFPDLATHVTRIEEPLNASYADYQVLKCGPWTQGPALIEALKILDGLRRREGIGGPFDAATIHLNVEALKLAFADRDAHFGDPLFVDVPVAELVVDPMSYINDRTQLIDRDHASLKLRPGDPRGNRALLPPEEVAQRLDFGPGGPASDTTTCLVADGKGNVIAATPSGWSGVLAGDTGIWLGSRLQSFNLKRGHPNALEPGKRPRITLTPTLVVDGRGKPVMAVSVAGGDLQDQVTLQVLRGLIDHGLDPAGAVTAPRYSTAHHVGSFRQPPPKLGSLDVNPGVGAETIERLRALGHRVTVNPRPIGTPTALRIDPTTGHIDAAGDPATDRHAGAY